MSENIIEVPVEPTFRSRVNRHMNKVKIGAAIAFTAIVTTLVARSTCPSTDSTEDTTTDNFDNFNNDDTTV